jgi:hypothetical protein
MSVFTPESGCSAERESVGINSRIQEFNCERAVTYRIVLSAYLFKVQPGNAQILFSTLIRMPGMQIRRIPRAPRIVPA